MSASKISVAEGTATLAVSGVCLDLQTYMELSQLLTVHSGKGLVGNASQYVGADRQAALALETSGTRVCIVDLDASPAEANLVIERLQAEHPDIFIFAVSASSDPELIITAMRNGCTDFLSKPLRQDALYTALRRVEIKQRERRDKKNRGKVISVIGAKGGTGVTTIALHLALNMAHQSGKKCLLIDQHPAMGDVSLYLGVGRHKYSFYELVGSTERLDEELLRGFVLQHDSGLDVLDSPESVDYSAFATPAAVEQTIAFLSEIYQYIVIDCPPGLSDATLSTLSQSDQIAIVLTAELPAVRNAVRYTEYLAKLGMNSANFYLILNRYSKKGPLGDEKLQKTLPYPIGLRVPNSYQEIVRSINAGTPVEAGKKSEFGSSIASWCQDLISQSPTEETSAKKSSGKVLRFLSL